MAEFKWPPQSGGAGAGDVVGPATSTDNAVARYNGTDGKQLQNSPVTIDDFGNIATAGTVDGRDISADGAALDAHIADTSAHGTTGDVVGTTDTQTLTNKTINGVDNTLDVRLTDDVSGVLPITNGGTGQTTANDALNALLPAQLGNTAKTLVTDGSNVLWADRLTTSLSSARIFVGNGSGVATAVAVTGDVLFSNTGETSIAAGAIVNADVNASAAIEVTKLATFTSAQLAGRLTDETGSGAAVFGTSPTLTGTLTMADSAGGKAIRIQANTTDGADDYRLLISSGGAAGPTRGAYVELHGNEFSSTPGKILWESGSAASGTAVAWQVNVGASSVTGHSIDGNGASTLGPTSSTALNLTVNGHFRSIGKYTGSGVTVASGTTAATTFLSETDILSASASSSFLLSVNIRSSSNVGRGTVSLYAVSAHSNGTINIVLISSTPLSSGAAMVAGAPGAGQVGIVGTNSAGTWVIQWQGNALGEAYVLGYEIIGGST